MISTFVEQQPLCFILECQNILYIFLPLGFPLSLSLSLTPPLTHPGTSKGGLISKEDVILALRNGSAKEGTAAKHITTPVSVAVSSVVAVPVVAHKAVVAAVAGEIVDDKSLD